MSDDSAIDLAREPAFSLGSLTIQPATRELIRSDDGRREVLEPRVMQVLVALAHANGRIVTRDELTTRCWEGRVVGEDAINRVISRLRRVPEGVGKGAFKIDTVTKVGYRLVGEGMQPVADLPAASAVLGSAVEPAAPRARVSRRNLILGGGAIAVLAGAGGWWLLHPRMSKAAHEAMLRGDAAMHVGGVDHITEAVAAFREAADLAPGFAEPLGRLATVYYGLYRMGHGQEAKLNAMRAREAATRALAIDPDNADAQLALAVLRPQFGNWLSYGAALAPVARRHPDRISINSAYIDFLSNVGRVREINEIATRLVTRDNQLIGVQVSRGLSAWILGKLDEADTAFDRASALAPRDVPTWFLHLMYLNYSGRPAMGLAMIADVDRRPLGIPDWDFDLARAESQAMLTRAPADIDAAAKLFRAQVPKSPTVAFNAVGFFSAVGRLDDAFAILEALFFGKGFKIGDRGFTAEQGSHVERRAQPTWFFWMPAMAAVRADPRLLPILQGIGLVDYWRRSGTRPTTPIAGLAGVLK